MEAKNKQTRKMDFVFSVLFCTLIDASREPDMTRVPARRRQVTYRLQF